MNKILLSLCLVQPYSAYTISSQFKVLDNFRDARNRESDTFCDNYPHRVVRDIITTRELKIVKGFSKSVNVGSSISINPDSHLLDYKNNYFFLRMQSLNDIRGNQLQYNLNNSWNLSLNPFSRINFSNMSQGFTGKIILKDAKGSEKCYDHTFNSTNLSPVINFDSSGYELSSNSNPFNLSEVRQLNFFFNQENQEINFSIKSIELGDPVPEPFCCTTIIAGLITLAKKRYRK